VWLAYCIYCIIVILRSRVGYLDVFLVSKDIILSNLVLQFFLPVLSFHVSPQFVFIADTKSAMTRLMAVLVGRCHTTVTHKNSIYDEMDY
jgi:hypothetical protein